MSLRAYQSREFIDAVNRVVIKMDEERRHRKFLEENTRKVLIEKTKKPKSYSDGFDVLASYIAVEASDFIVGVKTYKFEI